MAKKKFYVVWNGRKTGIFDRWETCKKSVDKFERAQFKSFTTLYEAEQAFNTGFEKHSTIKLQPSEQLRFLNDEVEDPVWESICVDASCLGNPGKLEYRGVWTKTGEEIFRQGPFENGTQNIGEFLAIVHGLAWLEKQGSTIALYTDSLTAIGWVKRKKHATQLEQKTANEPLFNLLERAEIWLNTHQIRNKILKWNTEIWGDIPADFGRK